MTQSHGAADHGFIDVNAVIGPRYGRAGGTTAEDLARERRSHGIRLALVHHRTAMLGEQTLGNRSLLEATAADPGLLPAAVLAPDRFGALEHGAAEFGPRVAAFWLAGRAAPTRPSEATAILLRAAARAGHPLFVEIEAWGDASVVGAQTEHLGVPVVLVGSHYNHSADDLAAARRYPHLLLETSRMAHFRAVETVVRAIGADRLLLGTGAPLRATQSAINAILLADITADEKRAILGGNAARLLGVTPAPVHLPDVWRPARTFDVHTHSGPLPWDVADLPDDELPSVLATSNHTGKAVASSILAIGADLEAGNRRTVEGCARMPDRLGYLVADPNDLDASRDLIRRWGDAPGIVGGKIHCQWSAQVTGSPAIWDLFAVLADWGRPVKIHNDGDGWDRHLLRIARQHPHLPIIIAHGGLGFPDLPGARLTTAADNIWFEMCSSFAQIPTVREVVGIVPPERFLFGTDAPLLDPGFVLGTYHDAQFPEAQQDRVFWDNAATLFGVA